MSQDPQVKSLYQMVNEKVDVARTRVDELREKLRDFDAKEQAVAGKEKASAYFAATLDRAQEALADLTKQAQTLKDNATEIPVRAFSNAFAKANDAFTDMKDKARAFDDQHQLTSKVSDIVKHPREQAQVAVATASSYVTDAAHAAYAQLQGVSDGIKCRVMTAAEQGIDAVMPVAASCDEKLHFSERAGAATDVVVQQVKAFNEKYHVADKLTDLDKKFAVSESMSSALTSLGNLDQRLTGGRVEPVISSAYEFGLQMAGYLKGKFEESKTKVGESASEAASSADGQPKPATDGAAESTAPTPAPAETAPQPTKESSKVESAPAVEKKAEAKAAEPSEASEATKE